ncbi:MAG: hypothetical protein KBG29_01610 [Pseudomonadales bacterium]|nr:hypothetical protein [Pseudomonadales bacterium]
MSLLIAPIDALTDPRLSDPERRVLLALFSFRGKDTNTVWPSLPSLGKIAHVNDPARVSKLTSSLAAKGWLTKRKKGFTGCNEYCLMVPAEAAESAAELLAQDANLAPETKLARRAMSNLVSQTKSNLAPETKYKEQTIEQEDSGGKPPVSASPVSRVHPTGGPACPHREIIGLYHEILPELQGVLVERWDGQRARDLAARWRESAKHQTPAFWRWFFGQVRKRRFYLGENDRGWRADLGWLVKRRNFDKILEAAVSAQRRKVAA